MKWEFVTRNGKVSEKPTRRQRDTVGNVLQFHGGVEPHACQKCKIKFESHIEPFPLKQKIPIYKCKNCDFENITGESAFDHLLLKPKHKIKKKISEKIVSYENKSVGTIARIRKLDDDIEILCDGCLNGS